MFNFFKKKPNTPKVSDKVWMSDSAKWTGFASNVKAFLAKGQKVCIFYFFKETTQEVTQLLEQQGIPSADWESGLTSASVVLVPALELPNYMRLQDRLKAYLQAGNQALLFAEHYPLHSKEQPVLEKIAALGGTDSRICFYVSLEEPLIKTFGPDRIINLMKQMGMGENEFVEHHMITSAIANAQKKLDSKVTHDRTADSATEWFGRNVK